MDCSPTNMIKLNVDASLAIEGWVGLGTVSRDSSGKVLTRRMRAHWSVEVAEAKAIEMDVRLGKRFGLQNVIVKLDCQTMISRLSKDAIFLSNLDLVLHNILSYSVDFNSII